MSDLQELWNNDREQLRQAKERIAALEQAIDAAVEAWGQCPKTYLDNAAFLLAVGILRAARSKT